MSREAKKYMIFIMVSTAIIVSYMIFESILLVNYGNEPKEEVPDWVLFFLWWKSSVMV